MVTVLFELFVYGRNMVEPRTIEAVEKKLASMNGAYQKVWGRKKAQPKDIKASLLVLIAAGILDYDCPFEPERKLVLSLKISEKGPPNLAYTDNDAWDKIPSWYLRK